jgi:hypothetical protein
MGRLCTTLVEDESSLSTLAVSVSAMHIICSRSKGRPSSWFTCRACLLVAPTPPFDWII